jgi:DNA-binding transcriptional regulator YhcF (GntR family)
MKTAANALREGTVTDEGRHIPKFKIILDALRESVISGEYREGARLPSEAELVRRFGVARMTIVKAFKELEQMGLVVRRPGSGTFVAPTAQDNRLFGLLIPELGQTEIFEPICQGMTQYRSESKVSLGVIPSSKATRTRLWLENCAKNSSGNGSQAFSSLLSN